MEFRLHYRGPLKTSSKNGDQTTKHKHEIRKKIHKQMQRLWQQMPLKEYQYILKQDEELLNHQKDSLRSKDGKNTPIFLRKIDKVENFTFVPLVNQEMDLIAELEIILLREEEPGVLKGSDLDNQLKTLLDALRMPKSKEELPQAAPEEGEEPFFCLLEDDKLVTRLVVEADRLLEPTEQNHVELLIHVRTKVTIAKLDNIGLGV